jgi:hypothetical protein
MKTHTLLALFTLLAPGWVLAQVPAPNPATALGAQALPAVERHPQAGCLGAVGRERRDFAGAVDQGLKTGRLDPSQRTLLENKLTEMTALETSARADKNFNAEACKGLYKRIVAENAGIQTTMRARPYGATRTAPSADAAPASK